jgi:hypothetical protein
VSRIDSIEDRRGEPDMPPRHPETGRFLAERHPVHADRNVKGEFIEDGSYVD